MLGYKDNLVVATHILAQAGRMAPVAERPLNAFVTSVAKGFLNSKDTGLRDIAAFYEAVGKANFMAIVDKLSVKEATNLLCRMDPHSEDQAKADPAWARARLVAVLTGEEIPGSHGASKPRVRASRRSKTPRALRSVVGETDAFSAKRRERAGAIAPAEQAVLQD